MGKREFKITDAAHGTALTVRIVPKASRTEIACVEEDGTLKIRLTAPPIEGQAREELVRFLAEFLSANPQDIEVVAGLDGRKMLVTLLNVEAAEVDRRIREAVGSPGDTGGE